jgi:hypothetical protein
VEQNTFKKKKSGEGGIELWRVGGMSFREKKRGFFSGSKTILLFAFCLSIRAAFPEGYRPCLIGVIQLPIS